MCLEEIYPPIQNMSSKELSKMMVDDKTMIKFSIKTGDRNHELYFKRQGI